MNALSDTKWDAVLIGSGISSLTTALLLQKRGMKVCVLERIQKPGGYLHSFYRFGHCYDTGAHYLGAMEPGQSFWKLLNYLGVYDEELFVPLNPEGFDHFTFPDFEYAFPKSYERVTNSLQTLFPSERAGLVSFFAEIRRLAFLFPTYSMQEKYDQNALIQALELPLWTLIQRHIKNPQLQALLCAHCGLHGVHPEKVSAGLHALMMDSFITGSVGMKRGGQPFANRFVRKIRENGGTVQTECEVLELRSNKGSGTIDEVITSQGSLTSNWVISGIHPKLLLPLVQGASWKPLFQSRIERLEESFGFMGAYGVAKNLDSVDPLKNYYVFGSAEVNDWFQLSGDKPKINAAFIVGSRRGAKDDQLPYAAHWPGHIQTFEKWYGTKTAKRGQDYLNQKQELGEEALTFIARSSAWRALPTQNLQMAVSTPLTNLAYNGSPDGTGYGILHTLDHTGMRALGPRTSIRNLLLTGQNTLFPGLLGASVSGLRTAGSLVGIRDFIREIRLVETPL